VASVENIDTGKQDLYWSIGSLLQRRYFPLPPPLEEDLSLSLSLCGWDRGEGVSWLGWED